MEDALSRREAAIPVTGEELLRMPWLNPCELAGGRIVRMTPTNPTHGRIEVNVAVALGSFVRTQNPGVVMAGEVGVRIPAQIDHLFRRKSITCSGANRSPVGAKRRGPLS